MSTAAARPPLGCSHEVAELGVSEMQSAQIHLEELLALIGPRPLELLNNCRAADKRWINDRHTVSAKERNDPPAKPAKIVNPLNQRIHGDLVFMVAVLLRACRREQVSLVNYEDGAASFARRLRYLVQSFRKQSPHLSDLAAAAYAVAQLEHD